MNGINEPAGLLDLVTQEGHRLTALTRAIALILVLLEQGKVGGTQAQGGQISLTDERNQELAITLSDDEVGGDVHKAPFAIIAVAIGRLGAEMRDEGVELGETLLAHSECRT